MSIFSDRVLELLKQKGISKNKLLVELNLGQSSFTSWVTRGSMPNIETVGRIADYLDCSIDYLTGRTDNPEIKRIPLPKEIGEGEMIISTDKEVPELTPEEIQRFRELLRKNFPENFPDA